MLESTMLSLLAAATIFDLLYHNFQPLRIEQAKRVMLGRFLDPGMSYNGVRQESMAFKYLFGGVKMIEDAYAAVRRVLSL
jgi:hypothetical protein